jgi:hypothetical protein
MRPKHGDLMDNSFDRVVGTAFHDVAVPEGLAERILARVSQQNGVDVSASGNSASGELVAENLVGESSTAATPATISLPGLKKRRSWLVTSAALATAACLLLGLGLWLGQSREQLFSEDVMEEARQFYGTDPGAPLGGVGSGQLLSKKSPPGSFPLPAVVVKSATTQWRWTQRPLLGQKKCVAFDLFGPKEATATLYVIRLNGPVRGPAVLDATSTPPAHPMTTNKLATATWIEGDLLYVLVVNGGEQEYRLFLRPSGAMAWLPGQARSGL